MITDVVATHWISMCSSHARHKDLCHRDLSAFTEICPLYSVILLSALALKKHGAMFYSLIHKFSEIDFPEVFSKLLCRPKKPFFVFA